MYNEASDKQEVQDRKSYLSYSKLRDKVIDHAYFFLQHDLKFQSSYASEKSHLITVSVGNDQAKRIPAILVFVMLAVLSTCFGVYYSTNSTGMGKGAILDKGIGHPSENKIMGIARGRNQAQDNSIKNNATWGVLQRGEHCLGYGTRGYSAQLLDPPLFANWKEVCESTRIEIHGNIYDKPERCERQWFFGDVVGYWLVKSEGTNCSTSWSKFKDKGCIQKRPGYRLMTSRFSNIDGEDIHLMCRTTPAVIDGIKYDKPASCVDRVIEVHADLWALGGRRLKLKYTFTSSMNRIFGASASRKPKPTLQDAINATDNRVASIEVKIKKLDGELARYKEQMSKLRGGPGKDAIQQRALRTLKQKRMYESQLAQLNQQVFNMESAALTTENMRNTMATFDAMQQANKELKKQYGKIDIDKIEKMHYDMEDMLEQANEIQESLARSYAVPDEIDEADLEAELDALALEGEEEGTSYLADLNKVPDFVDEPPVEVNEPPPQEAVKTSV
ncbi:hypothetical protein AX15_002299 [Amanita polypyramis BW_CC]|nr:hypothetical protein AX15_002299 [Amanita polypyramis BW_CC]